MELHFRGVRVASLKVPKGWTIEVEDLGYELVVWGFATADVGRQSPDFFRDFLILERIGDEPLHVTGSVTLYSPEDKTDKKIDLGKDSFITKAIE